MAAKAVSPLFAKLCFFLLHKKWTNFRFAYQKKIIKIKRGPLLLKYIESIKGWHHIQFNATTKNYVI